ncbi:MAG: hypothetical protein U1A72_05820 [Sulfuritalea sp.]|nr:hypothetical protein [Sulfuritalea sp.]
MTLEDQHTDRKSLRTVAGKTADWEALAQDCVCFANGAGGSLSRWHSKAGVENHVLKKRKASGEPQKPSADQNFPVQLETKDTMRSVATV